MSTLGQVGAFDGALDDRPPRLMSEQLEAEAFWRLRKLTFLRSASEALRTSRLRVSLVLVLSVVFWGGLYVLFYEGFEFLSTAIGHPGTHRETVQAIYNVFFVSLMTMLTLSAGIILYSGLYSTREVEFLLSLPVRAERIVLYKFQEAVVFSSWGFVLLGSPMLIAYGTQVGAPWYYFAMLAPFMLAFIYIPCGIGAIACLLLVRWVPRLRIRSMFFVLTAAIVLALLGAYAVLGSTQGNILTPLWFQEMLARLRFSEHRLLPSWWLSSGLLEAARGAAPTEEHNPWAESVLFLTLLVSNALVLHVAMTWVAGRIYRRSYSSLITEHTPRRPTHNFWLDRVIVGAIPLVSREMRLLLIKDLRLFRRDPVQWTQFLIFFGLLALYFANIRRFSYDMNYSGWVNMISFLNLAVVGLILSTFTTRFIFPMISLEGRRFWILGLLPMRREAILFSKFIFAAVGSMVPCAVLILLSDLMLQISTLVVVMHQLTCVILCLGLSGIAVGLGARMPDLREQSPSKIAAGFGGTLNLVLSACYIVSVVLLTALPCHFYLAAQLAGVHLVWLTVWLIAGTFASLVLGTVATVIPMRIGLRAFRNLEF